MQITRKSIAGLWRESIDLGTGFLHLIGLVSALL
jgi:hypothetical protein